MPEAACGGVKHVLAICGQDTKISKVAQQRDALLLRFKTEDEVSLPCPALYCHGWYSWMRLRGVLPSLGSAGNPKGGKAQEMGILQCAI